LPGLLAIANAAGSRCDSSLNVFDLIRQALACNPNDDHIEPAEADELLVNCLLAGWRVEDG